MIVGISAWISHRDVRGQRCSVGNKKEPVDACPEVHDGLTYPTVVEKSDSNEAIVNYLLHGAMRDLWNISIIFCS